MKRSKSEFFKTTTFKQALLMGPRRFVKDYLFPAMRREHGLGFAMCVWQRDTDNDPVDGLDEITFRDTPACHSVMCIGGTMQAILGVRSEKSLARVLGLPLHAGDGHRFEDASTLFYEWRSELGPWRGLAAAFSQATTPQEKERVAEKAVMAAIKIGERARSKIQTLRRIV